MDSVYKFSSTERIVLLEKELAVKLSELKTEVEDQGLFPGTGNRIFSSVQIPKDVAHFRREREAALKRTLQVAESKPLVIQADVLKRELESCLRREYTPENLPLLLLQYYTERITQLGQSKYLHVLRWKRLCQTSMAMEELYPLYKKQVDYIMQEFNDSVQRAERLSVARENLLMGKNNRPDLVTQEDLAIYTRWLVCHLHALRTIHHFLQALQYLPISRVLSLAAKQVSGSSEEDGKACVTDLHAASPGPLGPHVSGSGRTDAAFVLPQHVTDRDDLKPQLRRLLSHFHIPDDVQKLSDSAKEMGLFSSVSQNFQSIFMEQQRMWTFPDYEAGRGNVQNPTMSGPTTTLRKRADWIPFVKVKPKCDPWQKKMLTRLKERKRIDELMNLQSQFLKISDPVRVMQVLQDHAAKTVPMASNHPSRPPAQPLHPRNYDQVWKNIYSNPKLYQAENPSDDDFAKPHLSQSSDGSLKQRTETGYNFAVALQLLGLSDGTEPDRNPVLMRGAYLSFLCLRHLHIRELQRICLGVLNFFRSVERTLTMNTSGLTLVSGTLVPTLGDSSWINMSKGGMGTLQGLGTHHYIHGTPAEHKVHSIQFLEFSEAENQDDFHTTQAGYVHTQDQLGEYVVYDSALQDLKELESELLLIASHYIEKEKSHRGECRSEGSQLLGWAHANVDRFAVLYDLWTCETNLLEGKRQLLDSYFEAYQHTLDPEERFALAQAMTDIMHRRPKFDLSHSYFTKAYRDDCTCLRLHLQLVRGILSHHLEQQRDYVQRLWRGDHPEAPKTFGLPLNVICKQFVSISNSCPASGKVHPLELHPSLGLAGLIPKALEHLFREARHAHKAASPSSLAQIEICSLQLALDLWLSPVKPEAWYSAQLQRELFSAQVMGDPFLMEEVGLLALRSAVDKGVKQGQDFHTLLLDTFSRLLELLTLRHRLIETSVESAYLAGLYKELALEMGFEESHLHLRPVHFEFASHKDKVDPPPPVFITSLLEDSSRVDRYCPTSLVLAISELDDNQIGKFSFHTKEAILKLFVHSGVENMQVTLACQTAQRNALMVAIQQAFFYHIPGAGSLVDLKETSSDPRHHGGVSPCRRDSRTTNGKECLLLTPTLKTPDTFTHSSGFKTSKRAPEAFVSIQLEKAGLRDLMLNTFLHRKQTMMDQIKSPDDVEKVKKELIVEYCQKLNRRMSHYSLRGQIMAYCNSLRVLLDDFPTIRNTFFMVGQPNEKKGLKDSSGELKADSSRSFQPRPRSLLSADGRVFLNLWFIPHPSEVLFMFKSLPEEEAFRALTLTLQLVASLHDIVAYTFSFAKLGNCPACFDLPLSPNPLMRDWGGAEGIGNELQELQKMIDSLQRPQDPSQVAQALLLRREVTLLQFDAAMRHLLRTFLAAGNAPAYQSVAESACYGLPPLSNALGKSIFSSQLSLPQPLDPWSPQAFALFPWRAFLEDGGPFPVISSVPDTLEYDMQMCLCGLSDCDRRVAHGELVGVQMLMEDVLLGSCHVIRKASTEWQAALDNAQPDWSKLPGLYPNQLESHPKASALLEGQCDVVMSLSLLKSFLILWKRLEVLKEHWGRFKLRGQDINSALLHRQFSELYEAEILYPSMKALARQMGKEDEFEELMLRSQSILPPKGASEIEIKTQQLQKLLESLEIHMIQEVLRKVNREMTLFLSEKSKEESTLPTDRWKHQVMKENFSVMRPQIVERFVQRLMEDSQDDGPKITFRREHLEACILSLGCDVMARERSNFETYSMCYEHILQHTRQKLSQKEQEVDLLRRSQVPSEDCAGQVAELSHDMIMEITALRAQLTDLEEENLNLKIQIRKEVQEEYRELVQALFLTCLRIKEKLDENQFNLIQKVCELIGEVRAEGIANVKQLKKTWGSARPDEETKENTAKEQLCALEQDHSSTLAALLCKARSLGRWRLAVQQAHLRGQLSRAEMESILSKKECLRIKLMAEQEAALLHQQLLAARQALTKAQTDNRKLWRQNDTQAQLLRELEHRVTQDSVTRQQLDIIKTSGMEKLLKDVEQKEQKLQLLTEEAERASKRGQLQQKKMDRDLKQMRNRLAQERSVKLDAFQRVQELQSQLYDIQWPSVQMGSPVGLRSQTHCSLSSASTLSRHPHHHFSKTHFVGSKMTRRIQRPKTVPVKHNRRIEDGSLPSVKENVQLTTFQAQTAPSGISFRPESFSS
ncbi:coiled-coil domain containing 162 [Mus musculus]|nr:coiled-coil domain containing 162 [Mus musculus]|eukprot:XP_006512962.1 PREDICTED: coiled-coil domain containing 162 isoform X3 [Mus musculus]